jgi:hypothetical protein
VATLVDSVIVPGEEHSGQTDCVADTHPQIDMEIAREREVEQRRVWDAPGDTSPSGEDIRDVVVREEVVHPFPRCIDRKRSNGNVVEAQIIISYKYRKCVFGNFIACSYLPRNIMRSPRLFASPRLAFHECDAPFPAPVRIVPSSMRPLHLARIWNCAHSHPHHQRTP